MLIRLLLLVLIEALPVTLYADQPKIKIGIIAPMTGVGAVRGQSAREGLELATEYIVSRGILKNEDFKLIYQDVPINKPTQAAIAARHLTEIDKVSIIIGPMGSSPNAAAAPIIDRAKIPAITHTNSSPSALEGTTYLFRLWPTGKDYAAIIATELKKIGCKRVGILTATHDSPVDLKKYLFSELQKPEYASIAVVGDEEFGHDETDFKSALLKMSSRSPDILFLNLFEGQIGIAAMQARSLGLKIPFFTNAIMSEIELKNATTELEGVWFPRFTGYADSGKELFIKKFGREPPNIESAAAAHDALVVAAETLAAVGTNATGIVDYIKSRSFNGIIGTVAFRKNGDAHVPIAIYAVGGGVIAKRS